MKKCVLKNFLLQHLYSLPVVRQEKLRNLLMLLLASFLPVINYFIRLGSLVEGVDALMWVTLTKYYSNFNWVNLWYDRSSLGFARTPNLLEILLGLGNTIVRDPCWIYRITILILISTASIGFYKYMKHLINDSTASLIGALVYILNPWFLNEIVEGHLDILAGLGFFPLLLLAFEKRNLFLTAMFACIFLTTAHPQVIYAFGSFFICYLFVTLNLNRRDSTYLLAAFVLFSGLSMFYIMPFAMVDRFIGYAGLKPWTVEDISEYIMPLWLVLICFVVIFLPAVLAIKHRKEYKYAKFYSAIALFSMFLAVSPTFPILDNFYLLMFRYLPFFSIFRVSRRLLMITIFCVAYLVAILFFGAKNTVSNVTIHFRRITIPRNKVNRIIIVCAIATNFILSVFLVPSFPPQNYTPDPIWISNYEWLGHQPDDTWNVYTLPVTVGWIATPYGTTQDYGALSTLFSNKPVIGVPSKTAISYPFLKYLEYIVKNNVTDQWLKLLGAINVKYVTSGPRAYGQETFLLRQEGMRRDMLVYANRDAKVYENPFWTPMFKATSDVSLLVGGYNTILSLLRFSFNFSNSGLYFMKAEDNVHIVNYSSIIYEDFMDYLMLTLNDGIRIHGYQYGVDYTRDPGKDWVMEDLWKIEGKFVFNDLTLSVSGDHTLTIPFTAKEKGIYKIFVRTLTGRPTERGYLTVGNATIQPWGNYSFKWYNFGHINVTSEQHLLKIKNSGGRNDIDEIVLVKQVDLENHSAYLKEKLLNYEGRVIFSNKAYSIFDITNANNWNVTRAQFDCDGYVLYSATGGELTFKLNIGNVNSAIQGVTLPRADNYMIAFRAKTEGSMLFQVDDKTYSNIGSHDYNLSMFSLPSLGEGAHDVRIYFDETAYVDDVVIYSTSINETSSQKIFSNKKNDRIVLQKISSTEYILYLTKNEINESYLIATISYDDRWKAFVGDVEISPIKMNDILLSFPINVTGDLRIRLVFSGQKYVTLGYSITLITCSVIFITSLVRYIRKKRKENLCE